MPPMTAKDMGCRNSEPSLNAKAMGRELIMVEAAVIMIGRSRSGPASSMASTGPSPRSLRWLAKSTSKMALFTTIPTRRIMPIMLMILMVVPVSR